MDMMLWGIWTAFVAAIVALYYWARAREKWIENAALREDADEWEEKQVEKARETDTVVDPTLPGSPK